jgi:hypothetical protein
MPRSCHLGALLAALTSVSACHATYPLRAPLGADARELVVRFTTPRPLEARTCAGVQHHIPNVEALRGRAITVRNDTLTLEIEWLHKWERAWQPVSPTLIASVAVNDSALRIGERRSAPGRTFAAVFLGVPAAAWTLLFILCSSTPCFN